MSEMCVVLHISNDNIANYQSVFHRSYIITCECFSMTSPEYWLCFPRKRSRADILGGDKPLTMTMYNNTMSRIKKKVNLYGATAHILRHSYLTYMDNELEVKDKTLQTIAGHKQISTTKNIYIHTQRKNIVEAGNMMHNLLVN